MRVIVVGGGWAGLSAAVELARAGITVTLFEAARQLGGRARAVRFGALRVDNGQHLMLGAYTGLLSLLRTLDVPEDRVLMRRRLQLQLHESRQPALRLRAALLPAPLHLLSGLLAARGLPLRDKLRAISGWDKLLSFSDNEDISVAQLLDRHDQPATIQAWLWHPLCLAALNTEPDTASAQVFVRVLNEAFTGQRRHADLLFARSDLGAVLPQPAYDDIERHGGRVLLGHKVRALMGDANGLTGVRVDDDCFEADHVIIATPAQECARLLRDHQALATTAAALDRLETRPIVTVYLRYAPRTRLGTEMLGLLNATGQWVFDQRYCGRPGVMAVVISGDGAHMGLDNDVLAARVHGELKRLFPRWPSPGETLVVREKRATFACTVGSSTLRPACATALPNSWLAGDYTATGLPATLEGAVRSGQAAARAIIAKQQHFEI